MNEQGAASALEEIQRWRGGVGIDPMYAGVAAIPPGTVML